MNTPELDPTDDPGWVLEAEAGTAIGSRFAISNGCLGVRATDPACTYVAGLFDTPETENAVPGLVPAPDWLHLPITLSGEPLLPGGRASLDMRRGLLIRQSRHTTASGVTVRLRTLTLVSLADRAIGLQLIDIEIEQGTADLTLQAALSATSPNLVGEHTASDLGLWRTAHSAKRLAVATATAVQLDGQDRPQDPAAPVWHIHAVPGQIVTIQRIAAIVHDDTDPAPAARRHRDQAKDLGWRDILAAHEAAWATRWQASDITIDGDPDAQRALRFALYHLNSAADPANDRVSIGARALTGDDYRGHVFWDTEIFLLPFYSLTWPDAARAMLMYRFHTLDGARDKAQAMGWRGALYAWESTDTGEETTPDQVFTPDHRLVDVLSGKQEQHISADVAYAVWQYWRATADEAFLRDAGAEIILETARFWASRAQPGPDGLHHITGVIGPDEYHETIDDNAYTNVMARWNIRRGLDVAAMLRSRWPACWTRLSTQLHLDEAELGQWLAVADTMATGFDPATGLFEQFAGYFALEDIDLSAYPSRTVPMDLLLGRGRIQRSQIGKQADIVALLALLPEAFPPGADSANFGYYEPRCSQGSSLSPAMHGLASSTSAKPRPRTTAAFTSPHSAASGCWSLSASPACPCATTASRSTRISPPPGAALASPFAGVAVVSGSPSTISRSKPSCRPVTR